MNDRDQIDSGYKAVLSAAPLLLGVVLAGLVVHLFGNAVATDFDAVALGAETTTVRPTWHGSPIHCSDQEDIQSCLDGFVERGSDASAVWLGNSMLHAINQYSAGQENAPLILHRMLERHGLDLVTFSQPNANLQEHYALYEYLQPRMPLELLILPVVFDDFRETGIRETLLSGLNDGEAARGLESTEVGRRLLQRYRTVSDAAEQDIAGLKDTFQEKTETGLNHWLEHNSSLWVMRPELRGRFFIGLYNLRNTVLGIRPGSKRRMIPGRYEQNMAALETLLSRAGQAGVHVAVYIAPIRGDVEKPYFLSEYDACKQDVGRLAKEYGADYLDLEHAVPDRYWGVKESTSLGGEEEVDFMHFQAAGHQALAEALYAALPKETLTGPNR